MLEEHTYSTNTRQCVLCVIHKKTTTHSGSKQWSVKFYDNEIDCISGGYTCGVTVLRSVNHLLKANRLFYFEFPFLKEAASWKTTKYLETEKLL